MNLPAAALLEANALGVRAGERPLLEDITLQVSAGELLGIVGPNGAGKSTLLKVLAGVRLPDSGSLRLFGHDAATLPPRQRARQLAWLEQNPRVQWPLTVAQVVALGRLAHGTPQGKAARDSIEQALRDTDTLQLRNRSFDTLSEGEKLRVHLARVLAGQPRLLLADEPVAALDPWHQLQAMEQLRELAGLGLGVVVVLHELALAARFCNRLLLLDRGRVVATGSPHDVLSSERLAAVYRIDAELAPGGSALLLRDRLPD